MHADDLLAIFSKIKTWIFPQKRPGCSLLPFHNRWSPCLPPTLLWEGLALVFSIIILKIIINSLSIILTILIIEHPTNHYDRDLKCQYQTLKTCLTCFSLSSLWETILNISNMIFAMHPLDFHDISSSSPSPPLFWFSSSKGFLYLPAVVASQGHFTRCML